MSATPQIAIAVDSTKAKGSHSRLTNDIADWFPVLVATGVAVPQTEIIRTGCELLMLLEDFTPKGFKTFERKLKVAANRIGFPLFLRSGHTSAKHDWLRTCYVASEGDLLRHVCDIIEYGELSSLMGLPWDTWAVRELLPTQSLFTAFYHGLPITKERRYFIENGEVICHHPYWPIDSIHNADTGSWKEVLAESNQEPEEEVKLLSEQSRRVSRRFSGAWSLDWLLTERGWVAIDMAIADDSFHWPECAINTQRPMTRAETQ